MGDHDILLIGGDALEGDNIRSTLQSRGYSVNLITYSEQDIMPKIGDLDPHIILIDLSDEESGIKVLEKIRNLDIPIILCADESKVSTLLQTLHQGDGYLIRPFSIREFKLAMKSAVKQHQMRRRLQEIEERYRSIVENMHDVFYRTDSEGKLIMVSPSGAKIAGYNSVEEMIGLSISQVFYKNPEDRDILLNILQKEGEVKDYEVELKDKEGKSVRVFTNSHIYHDSSGKPLGVEGVFYNVSQLKNADQKLKEKEEKYRTIFDTAAEAIILFDLKGNIIDANKQATQLFGLNETELIDKNLLTTLPKLKINIKEALSAFKDVVMGKDISRKEWAFTNARGEEKIVIAHYTLIRREKKPIGITLLLDDITSLKKVEISLREKEENLKMGMDLAKLVYWEYDVDSDLFLFDDQFYRLYGTSEDQEGGNKMSSQEYATRFIPPEESALVAEEIAKALETDDPNFTSTIQHSIIRADGERREIIVRYRVVKDKNNRTIKTKGVNQDITEQKKAEEELRKSEARFRYLLDGIKDGVTLTHQGIVTYANPYMAKMLGFKEPEELIGRNLLDFMSPESKKLALAEMKKRQLQRKDAKEILKFDFIRNDGQQITTETMVGSMELEGKIFGIAIYRDITQQLAVQRSLEESEKKYRELYSSMNEGVAINKLIYDEHEQPVDYQIIDVNKAYEEILGVQSKDIIGKRSTEVYKTPKPPYLDIISKVIQKGEPVNMEIYFEPSDIYIKLSIFSSLPGTFVTIFEDITERKIAEKQIQSSLHEKEVLLQEIHHRVKNNMQIISSLLNLQTQYVGDEKIKNILQDSQNRVRAMAMIHEKLYQSPDLTSINFADYIQSLITNIYYTYATEKSRIDYEMDIEKIRLNIETAIPCGLIINELVSNSLKHAFPSGRKGKINFSMKRYDDEYELIISDNGIGMPEGLKIKETNTLGLSLVNNLIKQIDGAINLEKNQGTKFKIIFKESEYTKRIS